METVLVEETGRDPVQPIVPLGALIEELGCHLQWNKGSVKLWHPTRGFIKVFLNNKCPEVNFKEAHKLIKELEQKQLKALNGKVEELSAKLEVMRKEENRSWTELLNEFVKTGNRSLLVKVILLCPFERGSSWRGSGLSRREFPEGPWRKIPQGVATFEEKEEISPQFSALGRVPSPTGRSERR